MTAADRQRARHDAARIRRVAAPGMGLARRSRRRTLRRLQARWPITWSADRPDDLPLIKADPVLLEQLLVEPARKRRAAHTGRHAASASRRGIATKSNSKIVDDGPGFPPDVSSPMRLFEKFQRGVGRRRRRPQAASDSGWRSAAPSRARTAARSAPSACPAAARCSSSRCRCRQERPRCPPRRRHDHRSSAVLVIDDEPQLRGLLRTTLSAEGFRVIEAENARRGLIEAASHKPDIVILDLGLPDAEGHTVVRGIRDWSSMPIVVLSARVDEQQKIAALDAGADDYVTKPFAVRRAARARARGAAARARPPTSRPAAAARRRDDRPDPPHRGGSRWCRSTSRRSSTGCSPPLARHDGAVATQRQLLREVWGPDRVDSRTTCAST